MLTQQNKDKLVTAMKEHQRLDRIVKGRWFSKEENKGCHIGCCGESFGLQHGHSNFEKLSERLSIPEWVLRLSEKIFEGLEEKEDIGFSLDFCEALPVEVDIDGLRPSIEINRLQKLIVIQEKSDYLDKQSVIDAIKLSIECWKDIDNADWSAARSAAWLAESAAESAVESALSAAESAAWSVESAAWSAAESAESAVESAAWSAVESAESAESVESAAWSDEAEFLIKTLRNAK